jgi:hypothetical protein
MMATGESTGNTKIDPLNSFWSRVRKTSRSLRRGVVRKLPKMGSTCCYCVAFTSDASYIDFCSFDRRLTPLTGGRFDRRREFMHSPIPSNPTDGTAEYQSA